jgi:filamentous hemagglutinin
MMSKPGFAVLRRAFRLLRKAVAWIAAAILILSPASSPSLSQSRPVTPDPQAPQANRPDVGAARNGVPVIDIVKPNSDGVSHNKFKDFNVGEEGMILNNSPKPGPSALGGTIGGNPNLKGGDSARLILNEVTGVNRSQLDGYIEVFGPSAGVIIANPNGITCQGCGFHNVQHGILSTGRPVFDENGAFTGLSVDGGDVRIEMSGKREPDKDYGLDASGTDYFDIVSRSIVINGFVHGGKDLRYLFGRNTYNYASREVTAKADDGSEKPLFGLDSSALGGAYAGKITLIGTENGVGVKTPERAACPLPPMAGSSSAMPSRKAGSPCARSAAISRWRRTALSGRRRRLNWGLSRGSRFWAIRSSAPKAMCRSPARVG